MTVIRKEKYIRLAAQDFRWSGSRWPPGGYCQLRGQEKVQFALAHPPQFRKDSRSFGFIKKSQDEKIGIPCLKQRAERELSTKFKAKQITSLSPTWKKSSNFQKVWKQKSATCLNQRAQRGLWAHHRSSRRCRAPPAGRQGRCTQSPSRSRSCFSFVLDLNHNNTDKVSYHILFDHYQLKPPPRWTFYRSSTMVKEMVKTSLSSTSNFWQHTQHKNDWLPPSYSSLCTSRAGPRPLVVLGESPWPWLKIWVMLKNFDNILPSLEMKKNLIQVKAY